MLDDLKVLRRREFMTWNIFERFKSETTEDPTDKHNFDSFARFLQNINVFCMQSILQLTCTVGSAGSQKNKYLAQKRYIL